MAPPLRLTIAAQGVADGTRIRWDDEQRTPAEGSSSTFEGPAPSYRHWCGLGGACCTTRPNIDGWDETGCLGGTIGCSDMHCCVTAQFSPLCGLHGQSFVPAAVTPTMQTFPDGTSGNYIEEGFSDMYDGGNCLVLLIEGDASEFLSYTQSTETVVVPRANAQQQDELRRYYTFAAC